MDPSRNIGFLLKDVSRLWVRHFEQLAAQLGMTLSQAKVLLYLSRNEGTTQTRLAELSDTDRMTLVRILDRMENDGWLERRTDPDDRRAHRLHLKPAAESVLAEVTRLADKARAEALAGVSAEERAQLLTLLERIRGNLLSLVAGSAESAARAAEDASNVRA
ncbi:MAG TPA: MarR family transcriptional regulator [Gammaproteobacteria bacterium]|nr:MarR family transcriptional regulator [Gammaproteobacteria bacterium]